jgi:Helix-turn-helix domain of resolvase
MIEEITVKDRNKDIVRRYLDHEPITTIAKSYIPELSRQRVYQILEEQGVYRPHVNHKTQHVPANKKITDNLIDKAIEMYEQKNMSWTNIAKQLKACSRGTLYRHCTNKRPDLRKHFGEE